MFQISTKVQTLRFAPNNVTANQMSGDNDMGGLVHIQAAAANSGTVTILGVGGADGSTIDTYGPVLAAGDWHPPMVVTRLSQIAYKLSNSSDVVYVTVSK